MRRPPTEGLDTSLDTGLAIALDTPLDPSIETGIGSGDQRDRVDPGPPQHLDGPVLGVGGDTDEEIEPAGAFVPAAGGPPEGTFQGGGRRRRPAEGPTVATVVTPRLGLAHGGQEAPVGRVLDRALPAQAVADGPLREVAENTGELMTALEDGADVRVRLDERVQEVRGVDLPVPVPEGSAARARHDCHERRRQEGRELGTSRDGLRK